MIAEGGGQKDCEELLELLAVPDDNKKAHDPGLTPWHVVVLLFAFDFVLLAFAIAFVFVLFFSFAKCLVYLKL